MDLIQISESLQKTLTILSARDSADDEFKQCLSETSFFLSLTSADDKSRKILSTQKCIWALIDDIIANQLTYISDAAVDLEQALNRTRLNRGIVLFARNLVVGYDEFLELPGQEQENLLQDNSLDYLKEDDVESLYLSGKSEIVKLTVQYIMISKKQQLSSGFKDILLKAIISNFQFLSNLTAVKSKVSNSQMIFALFDSFRDCLELTKSFPSQLFDLLLPALRFANNISNDEDFINTCLKSESIQFSNSFTTFFIPIRDALNDQSNELSDNKRDQLEIAYLSVFPNFLIHQAFGTYVLHLSKNPTSSSRESIKELLRVNQILLSGKDEWDKLELTNITAWLLDYFQYLSSETALLLAKQSILTVDEKNKLDELLGLVISTLDCYSIMTKFDHVREMLNAYKFLTKLGTFFKVVELNTHKRKLKDKNKQAPSTTPTESTFKKDFPGVKSIIVEIITALVYKSFENQELIRTENILELILNNCNLDTNEPFIKERAILCLKFLLESNQENQKFIARLEARGTDIDKTNEEILENAGFEVDIVDGKVNLKKKAKIEEIQDKLKNSTITE